MAWPAGRPLSLALDRILESRPCMHQAGGEARWRGIRREGGEVEGHRVRVEGEGSAAHIWWGRAEPPHCGGGGGRATTARSASWGGHSAWRREGRRGRSAGREKRQGREVDARAACHHTAWTTLPGSRGPRPGVCPPPAPPHPIRCLPPSPPHPPTPPPGSSCHPHPRQVVAAVERWGLITTLPDRQNTPPPC